MTPKEHEIKRELLDGWAPGYGDTSVRTKEPWVVCSCGYRKQTYESFPEDRWKSRVLILEHQIEVLKEAGL